MPFFSVIIPTYNRRELLRQALASVWGQTFRDYELIVVDDGSIDGTWEELQALGSRVRALRQQNAGPGAARNLGAQRATGDYLAFLDSDDLWFPWTLKFFSELIRHHAGPSILSAKVMEFADTSELASVCETPVKAEAFADYFASHQTGYYVGAGMAVLKREAFLRVRGFTNQRINAEDHDLVLRLGTDTGFIQIISPVTLAWRRHPGSATTKVRDTFVGCLHLVEQERAGRYPGGDARAVERWRILTRHIRPVTLDCTRKGMHRDAWELYRVTFPWHARLGRWKYLAGFPLKAILARP
jgi:glycosyltransferase involved in cell wall biosynthesis